MSVCWGCVPPERHPGCHDHCPRRAAEVKRREEIKRAIKANMSLEYDMASYTADRVMRARNRIGKLSNR